MFNKKNNDMIIHPNGTYFYKTLDVKLTNKLKL